jgi:hypothetical protein
LSLLQPFLISSLGMTFKSKCGNVSLNFI